MRALARRVVEAARQAEEQLISAQRQVAGQVVVSVSLMFAPHAAEAVALLIRAHPGLAVYLEITDRLPEDNRATLHRAGMIGPARKELMALRLVPEGPELAVVDRSAMRMLGLWVHKVHVNGLEKNEGPPQVWLSRRAAHAEWNANRFDTLIAGGCAAGQSLEETVRLEGWQEAGVIPAHLAELKPISRLSVRYSSERGFLREVLIFFDLDLPDSFTPQCHDGEIDWAQRVSIDELHRLLTDETEMKLSSALVCRDLLRRLGQVPTGTVGPCPAVPGGKGDHLPLVR